MISVKPSSTPFLRLDANTGWQQSSINSEVLIDPVSAGLRLGKPGVFPISPFEPFGSFGGMTLPKGISVSDEGRVLLVDSQNNRILYFDSLTAKALLADSKQFDETQLLFKPLWVQPEQNINSAEHPELTTIELPGAYQLNGPTDVLFSGRSEVLIADGNNHRILIYNWPEFRLRKIISLGDGIPVAIAMDSRKNLYVVDSLHRKVLRYNRLWQLDKNFDNGEKWFTKPAFIAIDNEDNIFVIDTNPAQLFKFSQQTKWQQVNHADGTFFSNSFLIPPLSVSSNGLKYPQSGKTNCEALNLELIDIDKSGYLRGTGLPIVALPKSIRLPMSGHYISAQFDSEISGSQWHRIVLDVQVPATGRLLIQSYTSDRESDDSELSNIEWSQPMIISTAEFQQHPEMLIQSGPGRYLRIKLSFSGNGHSSPEVNSILIYGHRSSALTHLPPPFKQDPESRFFLDRFLSYFDTVQQEIRFLMQDFTRYLDPDGVPEGEFLEWLGSWFDWQFLTQWPVDLRREMIKSSVQYFKIRGTLQGLKQMLQWHTGLSGEQPQIIEHYRLRKYFSVAQAKEENATSCLSDLYIGQKKLSPSFDKLAHWFSVIVPASVVSNEESYKTLTLLIEAQKPAHTAFQLCIFNPGVRIGTQSSIGVDTWLGGYPVEQLGTINLGQSSRLEHHGNRREVIGNKILQSTWHKEKANGY